MLQQSNTLIAHPNEVLENNESRITRRQVGWTEPSRKGAKAPVIAVPISTPNQNTTQVTMVPPTNAFLISSSKMHSLNSSTLSSRTDCTGLTASTTSTSSMDDDDDWVGIEKDYWVIDGELIEDDLEKDGRNRFALFCSKFHGWMKMKSKSLSKKQHQHAVKNKKRGRRIANISDDDTLSSDMSITVHKDTSSSYYYEDQRQDQQYFDRLVQRPSFSNCSTSNESTSSLLNDVGSRKMFTPSPLLMIDDKTNSLYDDENRIQASNDEITLDDQHKSLTQKLLKIKEYILSSNILLQIKLQKKLHPHFYKNESNHAFHSNHYCPIISKQDIYIFLSTCRQEDNIIVEELLSCGYVSSLRDLVEHLCQLLLKNRVLYKITNQVFYIPSLLHHQDYEELVDNDLRCHASSVWSYKCIESWKVVLCHSWTFQTDVIGNIVMRDVDVISIVISGIFAKFASNDQIQIRHASCWKNACYLILTSPITAPQGLMHENNTRENIVEVFLHWVDTTNNNTLTDTHQYKELRVSAKGQCGTHGKRIYQGGYKFILNAIDDILHQDKLLQTLIFKKGIVCPECLAMNPLSKSCTFDYNHVIQAEHCGLQNDCNTSIVCDYGHSIDTRILTGTQRKKSKNTMRNINPQALLHQNYEYTIASTSRKQIHTIQQNPLALTTRWNNRTPCTDSPTASLLTQSFSSISKAVVLVGLWDPKAKRLISVGSGFIIDKKLGLIITAAHTLIHMGGNTNVSNTSPNTIGEDYYGCKHGKAIIGVIPNEEQSSKKKNTFYTARFRYSAEIIAKDIQNVDACILRITTKFEQDIPIQNQGEDIANISAEIPLTTNDSSIKKEALQSLNVSYDFEIQEQIRIIGYNQGGEGIIHKGMWIGGCLDFAFGYICKYYCTDDKLLDKKNKHDNHRIIRNPFLNRNHSSTLFYPRQEIVIICPTITGHSGGPCVNSYGEVVGILSRVDSVDSDRCYVVPACEWKHLLKKAKKICKGTSHPLDNFLKK